MGGGIESSTGQERNQNPELTILSYSLERGPISWLDCDANKSKPHATIDRPPKRRILHGRSFAHGKKSVGAGGSPSGRRRCSGGKSHRKSLQPSRTTQGRNRPRGNSGHHPGRGGRRGLEAHKLPALCDQRTLPDVRRGTGARPRRPRHFWMPLPQRRGRRKPHEPVAASKPKPQV